MHYDFFKGYVPTKNKMSLMAFKDKSSADLLTFEQAATLPEYAGILNDQTILVDIDDQAQSDVLMAIVQDLRVKCRVYRTTRGKHFLFLNDGVEANKTHTKLAIGLTADIKLGTKNSYSILKYRGIERAIIYDTGDYQTLPKFLRPMRFKADLMGMGAGDGRNQALFGHILTLQSNKFNAQEAKQCIGIINKYVFAEQLPDDEVGKICRDEAFRDVEHEEPQFFDGKKFLFNKFAEFLIRELPIKRINNRLHIFRQGIYEPDYLAIEGAMIEHIPELSKRQRFETLAYIDILVRENTAVAPPHLIAFKNGIYNLQQEILQPFTAEVVITNRIPWDYNPHAASSLLDQFLDQLACQDGEIRSLLEECIGSCFYRDNKLCGGKAFILTGDKSNGKSTFFSLLHNLLGERNTSSLDLSELSAKFQNAELFGKLANIGDDISDKFIVNPSVFKKLVTGEKFQVQHKGERPFEFNNYAKMLFSANTIPRMSDRTGAVLRRLIIVPFNAHFTPKQPGYDPNMATLLKAQEVMEYAILLGLKALRRVADHQAYTDSAKVDDELEEYHKDSNPVLLFFEEIEDDEVLNEPVKDVFEKYYGFCVRNNLKAMSQIEFGRQVITHYNVRSKPIWLDGQKVRIYTQE